MSIYTQVRREGVFELTPQARVALVKSKYCNEDLIPTSAAERTWTTYSISMFWICMSISIPTLALTSISIAYGLSPLQSVLNVFLANILILIPIILNSHAGARYGISFPVLARASFGYAGAHLPAFFRAFAGCGWFSIQAWVGGGAIGAFIGVFIHSFADTGWLFKMPSWSGTQEVVVSQFVGFVIFIIIAGFIALRGQKTLRVLNDFGGIVLIAMLVLLLAWSYAQVKGQLTFFGVMRGDSNTQLIDLSGGWLKCFSISLMVNMAYWSTMALNISDFTRYAKAQKCQRLGQFIGLPLGMLLSAFVGTFFAQTMRVVYGIAIFDPTDVFYYMDSKPAILLASAGTFLATITTCVPANLISPALCVSNFKPKRISYKAGVIITIVIAFVLMQPWWIYGSGSGYFTLMDAFSTVLSPIAAIMIADYWIIHKRKIAVGPLFRGRKSGHFYSGGWSNSAVFAWFIAFVIPLAPQYFGFTGAFFEFVASISYIWSFFLGFVVYIIFTKIGRRG